jgi:hypothetical protein
MDVAQANYEFLRKLRPYKKLRIDSTGRFCYDNRWGQGARRYWTGDSKLTLLENIEKTFNVLYESDPLNSEDEQRVIGHISEVLQKTYPKYSDLHGNDGLLSKLLERSRITEAQRKAHELLTERNLPKTNTIFEPRPPEHATEMPAPTQNSVTPVSLNDFILDLNHASKNKQSTSSRRPIVHDIIDVDVDLDERPAESGCCLCLKRKQRK